MKNKIIKAICFISILIIILIILSYIVIPKNNTKEAGMHYVEASGILAEKENTIDMIVIGDSEAVTSIIPMQMWNDCGFSSYICATLEQTIPQGIYILSKAFEKQKPKVLMVEVNNIFAKVDRDELITETAGVFLPVVEYHDRWKSITNDDFGKIDYNTINHMKGYRYTNSVEEADDSEYMKKDIIKENTIPRLAKTYIELLNAYCNNNGIKLIAIKTPTTTNWNYSNHRKMDKFLNKEKIEFLDLNENENREKIKIDWRTDSKDGGDHLNHYGAKKVTNYLEKYLSDMNILQDHRNDIEYSNWNDSYEIYKKEVNE